MSITFTHGNYTVCNIDRQYYPDHPCGDDVERIHAELARQWDAIRSGHPWDPDRLPETVAAVLEGPLAWRRIPLLSMFDPGPEWVHFLAVWSRPDGLYLTLSSEGAKGLGMRPVGLTTRRQAEAAEAGELDAQGDLLTGDRALIDGTWLPIHYLPDPKRDRGYPPPLYRWTQDRDGLCWRVNPQEIGSSPILSLDAIGPENLPDECCEAEKAKVFTRPVEVETDRVAAEMRAAVG